MRLPIGWNQKVRGIRNAGQRNKNNTFEIQTEKQCLIYNFVLIYSEFEF